MGKNTLPRTWRDIFDQLFNKRKFQQAYDFLLSLENEPYYTHDANYWAKRALCELTLNKSYTPAYAATTFNRAKDCTNYNPSMLDAFRRDVVIWHIRHDEGTFVAEIELQKLLDNCTDDNLRACYYMIKARLLAKQGKLTEANVHHDLAWGIWRELGNDANRQWIRNNNWWWLINLVREHGYPLWGKERQILDPVYYDVITDHPTFRQFVLAHLLRTFGRPLARRSSY